MSKVWQWIALSSRSHWSLVPWYTETRPLRRSLPSTWRSWPQPTLRHNSTFYPSGGYLVWKSIGPVYPVWLTLIDSNLNDCRLMMWPAGDLASWHSSESSASQRRDFFSTRGMRAASRHAQLWPFWLSKMSIQIRLHVLYSSLNDSDFMSGFILDVTGGGGGVLKKVFNTLNIARIHFLNQYFCLKQDTLDKLNSRYVRFLHNFDSQVNLSFNEI